MPCTSYHCRLVYHSKLWFTIEMYHVVHVAYHSKLWYTMHEQVTTVQWYTTVSYMVYHRGVPRC